MREGIDRGVGGFIFFGGARDAVRELTGYAHAASRHPLLMGSDLERGAGQQFAGATILPPPAALAAVDDLGAIRACGRLTAEEAREMGINWVLGPVADLDVEPRNPIVSTRSFGADATHVARQAAAWVSGCEGAGAMACVKHFPGHGRTRGDSHLERPTVDAPAESLRTADLLPFAAAFRVGAASVMTAHVSYPALDPSGEPATLSAPIIEGVLRSGMGFEGLVVSDAIGMAGLSGAVGEGEAAVRAILAGCDVLLYPEDPAAVVRALGEAVASGRLLPERLATSIARVDRALRTLAVSDTGPAGEVSPAADVTARQAWADGLALRSIVVLRGDPRPSAMAEVLEFDDDVGGAYPPPSRAAFLTSLQAERSASPDPDAPPIVALYSDPRGWKGRADLSESIRSQLAETFARSSDAILVLFGHPRLAEGLDSVRHVVCAWGGDEVMQRAAGRWLADRSSRIR